MIPDEWRRVCGLHLTATGSIAVAWLAHDRETDTVHLYDCAFFKKELPVVVADGISARGRWIPIAWPKHAEELVKQIGERGCNTEPKACADTDAVAQALSLEIETRMRTHRFKVEKRLGDWLDEFKTFRFQDAKIPVDSHPLIAATRNAIGNLKFARRRVPAGAPRGQNYPNVRII